MVNTLPLESRGELDRTKGKAGNISAEYMEPNVLNIKNKGSLRHNKANRFQFWN